VRRRGPTKVRNLLRIDGLSVAEYMARETTPNRTPSREATDPATPMRRGEVRD